MLRISTMALAVVFCGFETADAADRFGVVGIENSTQVTVRLQHRWGDGSWDLDVLSPGGRKWFWSEFQVANQDKTPPFHVRFDSDLSPGKFVEKYNLKMNQAPDHDWNFSHKYILKYDGNRTFVDLFEEK
jgi:hypothetical protein